MAAVKKEPPRPEKARRFVVTDTPVDGVDPGDTVTIKDPVRALQLIQGGHITVAPAEKA